MPPRDQEGLPYYLRHQPGIHTDPIWMEFLAEEIDPESVRLLAAIRLETSAAVYGAIAEGAKQAAQVVRDSQAAP